LTTRFPKALRGVACALLAAGCTTPSDGVSCPRREAAFRLELTAPGVAVPPDTTIEVLYQGSATETFSLIPSSRQNEDVCCRLGVPTDGVLPHVACAKNPPPDLADASPANDAGELRPASGVSDAALGQPASDAGKDPSVAPDGGAVADASSRVANGGPKPRAVLFCELLTNGPATIHVTASGYPALDQELQSKLRDDGCGVRTVDVHTSLIGPDGGSP
jgi:hypothetical protein